MPLAMPARRVAGSLRGLATSTAQVAIGRSSISRSPVMRRTMATVADLPPTSTQLPKTMAQPPPAPARLVVPRVRAILYEFPSMEPIRFERYSPDELLLPLRKDILHRAIVMEGDNTRQGTANTKWRDEIHGSNVKMRPQKGMGRARIGDRKSPSIRGGGVAFGPKPRDFGTKMNRKEYDLAWRTALSYRYRRGELIVVEGEAEIPEKSPALAREIFEHNGWGPTEGKRSIVITMETRPNLFYALEHVARHGRAKTLNTVDVKNLLEGGRLIIEKSALKRMLNQHKKDLGNRVKRVFEPPSEAPAQL